MTLLTLVWEFIREVTRGWVSLMSGILGIVFSIIAIGADSRQQQGTFLVLSIAAFGCAAFRAWRTKHGRVVELEKEREPKIEITCDSQNPACKKLSAGSGICYFRAIVRCIAPHESIFGCKGHLVRIEKNGQIVGVEGVRTIPFAPSHGADAAAKTLHADAETYLDVIAASLTPMDQVLTLPEVGGKTASIESAEGLQVDADPGDYLITIRVSGNNVSSSLALLKLKWSGDYQTSEISLVSK